MKRHPALWGALLLAALGLPALAWAAGPSGSGDALYANGTALVLDTEENMNRAVGNLTEPVNAVAAGAGNQLAGFSQGAPGEATAVAYWRAEEGVYYVRLTKDTVVYGGGSEDGWLERAKLTMQGGEVKALCPWGQAGGVEAAELTVIGGKAGRLELSGGAVGRANLRVAEGAAPQAALGAGLGDQAEITLNAPGMAVEAQGEAALGSLGLGPGVSLRIPPKASLTVSGALELNGAALANQGAVTAGTLEAAGSLTNAKGARLTAGLLNIKPGGQLINQGEITLTERLSNQGAVILNGGRIAGDITSAGAWNGSAPLAVAAGDTFAVTGGAVRVAIENSGTLAVSGGTVQKPVTNSGSMALTGGAVTGGVTNGPGGALQVSGGALGGQVENQGSMEATGAVGAAILNNGTLALSQNGAVAGKVANGGTLLLADAASLQGDVENRAGGVISGGALAILPGKTLVNQGRVEAPLVNEGAVENKAKGQLTAALSNDGSLENAGELSGGLENGPTGVVSNTGRISGTPLRNAGTLANRKKGVISSAEAMNTGAFTNEKQGTVTEEASLTNTGSLENAGAIAGRVENQGVFTNAGKATGEVVNAKGAALSNSGALQGPVSNAGELANTGVISGSLENAEGGSVANEGKVTGGVSNGGFFKNTGRKAAVTGAWDGSQPADAAGNAPADSGSGVLLEGLPYGASLSAQPLPSEEANYSSLLHAANGGSVLCSYELSSSEPITGPKTLVFALGEAYARKRVSGLCCVNGIVTRYVAKADQAGRFRMPVEALGSFMVVAGNGAASTGKLPKTG